MSCDDLGICHAANEGVFAALRSGVATCASLMVPAPWARDAANRYHSTDDIGVHLTLNCEYAAYRFGPITHAPSLQSGEGGFPRSVDDLWEHADPEEVLRLRGDWAVQNGKPAAATPAERPPRQVAPAPPVAGVAGVAR